MLEKNLFILAGCNGAGKTTAAFTLLPEILECQEFVNADEIARGLSPFQPEKVAFEAGRIMLERMNTLLANNETFAFETTLATNKLQAENRTSETTRLHYYLTLLLAPKRRTRQGAGEAQSVRRRA